MLQESVSLWIENGLIFDMVVEVRRLDSRLMSIGLVLDGRKVNVICGYAPQAGRSRAEKLEFLEKLENLVRSYGEDELWIGGDFNAHVGVEKEGFEGSHGGFGIGERNEEGTNLLDCVMALDCCIMNTYFKKEDRHLLTYKSGENESMIDYWIVKKEMRCRVKNVKVIANEECVQQHRMVLVDWCGNRKKKRRKASKTRLKCWKLKDEGCRRKLKEVVDELLQQCEDADEDVNVAWNSFAKAVTKGAEIVLGRMKGEGRRREAWWWCKDVKLAIEEKRKRYKEWQKAKGKPEEPMKRQEYVRARREARKQVAVSKEKSMEECRQRLSTLEGREEIFKIARQRKKERKDITQSMYVKKADGNLAHTIKEGIQRWKEYFSFLLNEENSWDGSTSAIRVEGPIKEVEPEEVREAIRKMHKRRTGGPSEITADILKALGETGVSWITRICNLILMEEKIPNSWQFSDLIPIYKGKGDATVSEGASR